jgi:hypothetical protein
MRQEEIRYEHGRITEVRASSQLINRISREGKPAKLL